MIPPIELPQTVNKVLYVTGFTPTGERLIGGVWKLWEQEGFPLEMSHLLCQERGARIDWLEAMADASTSNNLPALTKHIEAFLPGETVVYLKRGFMAMMAAGNTAEEIVECKHANSTLVSKAIESLFS